MSKLQSSVQLLDESLDEFAERVQHYAVEGYPGMPTRWVQLMAVDVLLKGCLDKRAALQTMDKEPAVLSSTGFTPNYLMLGREVMRPLDLMLPKMIGDVCSREANFVTKYQTAFQRAHEIARQNLKAAQFRQKRDYDEKLKQTSYEVGDIVLRQKDAGVVGVSKKLLAPWSDPWIVAEVISATSYRIVNRNRSTVVHHDKLKKCTNRSFPLWVLRRRQRIIGGEEQHDDADLMGEIDETDLPNLFDVGQETIPETLAAEDSDSGEVELDREDTAVAGTNINRGRYGRTIMPPARWGDYELW